MKTNDNIIIGLGLLFGKNVNTKNFFKKSKQMTQSATIEKEYLAWNLSITLQQICSILNMTESHRIWNNLIRIFTHTNNNAYTHTHTHTHTLTYTHTLTHIHTHMHTRTLTHVYSHISTRNNSFGSSIFANNGNTLSWRFRIRLIYWITN